jgi:hypothetical protein
MRGQFISAIFPKTKTGRPLGRLVKRQNVVVPNFFFVRSLSLSPRLRSLQSTRIRHFGPFDSRCAALQEAIRSVTHLVLVPCSLHLKSFPFQAPNLESSRSRKRSVPRPRSFSSSEFWFAACPHCAGASNPFVTRVSVESLSKTCSLRVLLLPSGKRPSPISPKGFLSNPFPWLAAALQIYFFIANSGNTRFSS